MSSPEATGPPIDRPAATRPGHVFISFKTEEREEASLLEKALKADGYVVWWQAELQCGQEWHGEIDRAVKSASCVVVLWSARSSDSIWVRHEASQAIARDVYAPARIDTISVRPPFNRIQASDLVGWSGDRAHPGYLDLLRLVDRLVPLPENRTVKIARWLRKQRTAIIGGLVGALSLALLVGVTQRVGTQVRRLETVATDVGRLLHPVENFFVSATIRVDPVTDDLRRYQERVLSWLDKRGDALGPKSGGVPEWYIGGRYEAFRRSILFPSPDKEANASDVMRSVSMQLQFYRHGQPDTVEPIRLPDLTVTVYADGLHDDNYYGWFRRAPRSMGLYFERAGGQIQQLQRTGRILSVDDLRQAELQIHFDNRTNVRGIKGLRLESIAFTVSGQSFSLTSDMLEEARSDAFDVSPTYRAQIARANTANHPMEFGAK